MSEKRVFHKKDEVAQAPHTAEECKINAAEHAHPDNDCGHFVNSGPAVEPIAPPHSGEQDAEHGPGVQ